MDAPTSDDDDRLLHAARDGDVAALAAALDARPHAIALRTPPYGWSLLHEAAHRGHRGAVALLLARGADPEAREDGDNTTAMYWAAAAGHLDVVRQLADAGADVASRGDVHELEVIGWATCWDDCHDDAHRAIARFLRERGARGTTSSAVALADDALVRAVIDDDPHALERRMSSFESRQSVLHFAVRHQLRAMIPLLLQMGADPRAIDDHGMPVAAYATSPDVDRVVMEAILASAAASDDGGGAGAGTELDFLAALAVGDFSRATTLARARPALLAGGALHLMAKRGDVDATAWLLAHGCDPNAIWAHYDADVTPLHMVAFSGNAEVARRLVEAGADPRTRDSKHDGDAIGWAEHFGRADLLAFLRGAGQSE